MNTEGQLPERPGSAARVRRFFRSPAVRTALAFLVLFALVQIPLGTWRVRTCDSLEAVAVAAAAGAAVVAVSRRRVPPGRFPREAAVLGAALLLCTLTTYAFRLDYSFFGWAPERIHPGDLPHSRMLQFLVLSPVLALPFSRFRNRRWLSAALFALFVGAETLAVVSLLRLTGGAPVYSDDHPSFLFRLQEFWGSFPWRENYVPHWNAGVVNNVLVSSGVGGYAWLTAPLRLLLGEPHRWHAPGMALVHAVFLPWLAVWGLRACRLGWRAAWTGGLLLLFPNGLFFLWTFHFGTAGAGVSWGAAPAACLFLYAAAELKRTDRSVLAGLVLSFFLLCSWPQDWIFAVLLALAAATSWRSWSPRAERTPFWALAACGVAVALLLAPSLEAMARGRELIGYTTDRGGGFSWAVAWKAFLDSTARAFFLRAHPLVAVFGLAGACALPRRAARRWAAVLAVGGALAYSVGAGLAPNMQLHRMAIPLALVCAVPAAVRLDALWGGRRGWLLPLQGAALALLVLGAVQVGRVYGGNGFAPPEPMPPVVPELARWLEENVPEGSRAAFAGPTSHAYGHGHVAYFPFLAHREMMACDYYEFPPGTFENDFPPRAARSQPGGLHGYFADHGVRQVVTCRPNYIEYFSSRPGEFAEGPRFRYHHPRGDVDIRTFEVLGAPGTLQGAAGTVSATFNRIEAELDGPVPERFVLAYHWNDRLRADPPAAIAPVPTRTPGEDPFIGVEPHGARRVRIRYDTRF